VQIQVTALHLLHVPEYLKQVAHSDFANEGFALGMHELACITLSKSSVLVWAGVANFAVGTQPQLVLSIDLYHIVASVCSSHPTVVLQHAYQELTQKGSGAHPVLELLFGPSGFMKLTLKLHP